MVFVPLKNRGRLNTSVVCNGRECAVYTLRRTHMSQVDVQRCGECVLLSVYTTHTHVFVGESCHSKPVKSTT